MKKRFPGIPLSRHIVEEGEARQATLTVVPKVTGTVVMVVTGVVGQLVMVTIRISPGRAVAVGLLVVVMPGRRRRSRLVHISVGIETIRLLVVAALVAYISLGASPVEVAPVRVVVVDVESPAAVLPSQRAIEVALVYEPLILPGCQNILQVAVATLPPGAVGIFLSIHTHQVVQIDLIDGIILGIRQVQFIGHLIREEKSLFLSCVITYSCRVSV